MKKILLLGSISVLLLIASCRKDGPEVIVGDELKGDGTFEYDGRSYVYKTFGAQTWMIENLAYLPSVSPSSGGSDSVAFYYVFGYEGSSVQEAKATDNYSKYGVLYNLDAAKTACPSGWHLPTDEEWKTLEKHLGMSSSDADATRWRNSGSVGKKLKSGSGWINNGQGDNSSGFTALPGGDRYNLGGFMEDLGALAFFWSSSNHIYRRVWSRCLDSTSDGVFRISDDRRPGFSVRCLKNEN
jgi:uncharacterized protein (TIGR02145 family)